MQKSPGICPGFFFPPHSTYRETNGLKKVLFITNEQGRRGNAFSQDGKEGRVKHFLLINRGRPIAKFYSNSQPLRLSSL